MNWARVRTARSGLAVRLFSARLRLDKAHGRAQGRLDDRFGVGALTLVALHQGFDASRGDQRRRMPDVRKHPRPVMSATAGLHRDRAGRMSSHETPKRHARQRLAIHDRSVRCRTMQREQVPCQIHPDNAKAFMAASVHAPGPQHPKRGTSRCRQGGRHPLHQSPASRFRAGVRQANPAVLQEAGEPGPVVGRQEVVDRLGHLGVLRDLRAFAPQASVPDPRPAGPNAPVGLRDGRRDPGRSGRALSRTARRCAARSRRRSARSPRHPCPGGWSLDVGQIKELAAHVTNTAEAARRRQHRPRLAVAAAEVVVTAMGIGLEDPFQPARCAVGSVPARSREKRKTTADGDIPRAVWIPFHRRGTT